MLYTAYGLGILSDLPFPELLPADRSPDVRVRLERLALESRAPSDGNVSIHASPHEARMFYPDVGELRVREGREIVVRSVPGVDDSVLRLHVLGPALSHLLYQRGALLLHGSAVECRGGAVAILGYPRAGKSTVAARLLQLGHTLLADDITAVTFDGGVPTVQPGFPQVKLWPEVAALLGDDAGTLPRVHPRWEKRARRISHGFCTTSLPLRRVYILAEGEESKIAPLGNQQALLELLCYSYVGYTTWLLEATGTSASHFHHCCTVIQQVPVRRLYREPGLSTLDRVVEKLTEELGELRA